MDYWAQLDNFEDGVEYKRWLSNRFITRDIFNKYDFDEINAKRTAFELWKERQSNAPEATAAAEEQQTTDRTNHILDSWCRRLTAVPSAEQLQAVVQEPLQAPLPYSVRVASVDNPAADVMQLANAAASVLLPELGVLRDSIFSGRMFGDNEDSVHGLVDLIILRPMALMGDKAQCSFAMQRNGVDSTGATTANLRPDVLVWLPSNVLAFKGEDKASQQDIRLARTELMKKLNCFTDAFFGSLPYQICYACGGHMLEFNAIIRNNGNPVLRSISPVFNLRSVQGRSLCVRYAVNITRVLIAMQTAYPEGPVARLGNKIDNGNSQINIIGTYVVKKTQKFTSRDVLDRLYSQIQGSQPPSLVFPEALPKYSRGQVTLQLSPVGFCGKPPGNPAEAKAAGLCVLQALEWLHRHGWVHRDIRPSNIMYAEGRWYLMDLEWAGLSGSPIEDYRPKHQNTPPELRGVDGMAANWTQACDMWQFGELLRFWNALNSDGNNYVNTQTSENPTGRLSANQSLTHPFFA